MAHVLVTSFNSTYFKAGLTLVAAVHRTSLDVVDRIIVYDLGLTPEQCQFLGRCEKVEVRPYPDVVKTFFKGYLEPRQFAWKPCAIKHAGQAGDLVFWLDAGAMPVKSLQPVYGLIERDDIFLVQDESLVAERTLPRALRLMKASEPERSGRMLCAGIQGHRVDGRFQTLIDQAYVFSQNPEIVRGPWEKHRHDQSIYSVLAVRHQAPTQSLWQFGEFRGPDVSPDQVIYVHRGKYHNTAQLRLPKSIDLSVCLSTHNGRKRIGSVLDSLSRQKAIQSEQWEVLVVDNDSSDGTAEVVESSRHTLKCELRMIHEPRRGLLHARRAGVLAANGRIVILLDDDMALDPEFVAGCKDFFSRHPTAGLVGGRILPELDAGYPKPEAWNEFKWMLGVRDDTGTAEMRLDNHPDVLSQPYGGGSAIRTQLACEIYLSEQLWLSGRSGRRLSSSEDIEMAWHVLQRGWELWYSPVLCSHHRIPPDRLRESYLRRLNRGISRSNVAIATLMSAGRYPPGRKRAMRQVVWAIRNLLRIPRMFPGRDLMSRLAIYGAWGRLEGTFDQLWAALRWRPAARKHDCQ